MFGKINKLSLPVTILLASFVIGSFYFVGEINKQKSIERQQTATLEIEKAKIDQTKKEQEQIEEKEAENKKSLNSCLLGADNNYSTNWYRECKSEGKLSQKCITLHEMTFEEYAKQNNIPSIAEDVDKHIAAITDFYKQQEDCSCRLPQYNADSIDKTLQNDKAECFKKYN